MQATNTNRHWQTGRRAIGWKVGLTNPAVQAQLGVDQPDFGILFADTERSMTWPWPISGLLQPRVEAEVAFVLGDDLATARHRGRRRAGHDVRAPGDRDRGVPIAGWDITIVDTIADNASSGAYVVGAHPSRCRASTCGTSR